MSYRGDVKLSEVTSYFLVSGGHLREEDVAIVEWVNRQSRFSGIIKQRFLIVFVEFPNFL